MKVTCETCTTKACCYQAVDLSKADIKRFKKYKIRAKIDYTIIPNINKYYLHLEFNDKLKCQFLDDNGKCSIYEARPDSCRIYECKAMDKDWSYFKNLDDGMYYEYLTEFVQNRNNKDVDVLNTRVFNKLPKNKLFTFREVNFFELNNRIQQTFAKIMISSGASIEYVQDIVKKINNRELC